MIDEVPLVDLFALSQEVLLLVGFSSVCAWVLARAVLLVASLKTPVALLWAIK